MRLLMEHPDQLQYLVDNPNKIAMAIDEVLRYNTPFIQMRRTVVEDVELAGQQLFADDKVMLHYPAANHDEFVFGEDSIQFDIHRGERQPKLGHQLRSFGIGQHFCLGSYLARLEMKQLTTIMFASSNFRMSLLRADFALRHSPCLSSLKKNSATSM
jgi:cholest-4-en-3-one 26-monooxygenase